MNMQSITTVLKAEFQVNEVLEKVFLNSDDDIKEVGEAYIIPKSKTLF